LDDLRSVLTYVAENAARIGREVGNVAPASIAAIQRALLQLEQQGGDAFFGEPALRLEDMIRVGLDGRGQVNVLDSTRLMNSPRLYAAFLLWLLSELFEQLPEIGDPDKPRLVFFFDEAHLLFRDAPRLAQLGNRIQHALRAYTPSDQRGLRAASDSFRVNPAFDTADAIQALGTGEALVSTLDEKGAPTIVQRTLIRPPDSRLGPATDVERAAVMAASPVKGVYDTPVDRESAEEILAARHARTEAEAKETEADASPAPREPARGRAPAAPKAPRRSNRQTPMEALTKSVLRTAGSTLTRELLRGVLGGLRRR
ncbi:MAG: ATP-binding protein, partial [Brevundimonas sp. 12-68-7]